MKRILHVACSPRKPESESEQIAPTILELLPKRDPTAVVIRRTVGDDEISHIDASYATALGATQPTVAEALPEGSMAESEDLIQELESSDILVIETPMHNFTAPSGLKAWIDHIVRVRRTFNSTKDGYVGTLRDRPVFVAVSSGGRYSGGRAPAGFSHALSQSRSEHDWAARSDIPFHSTNEFCTRYCCRRQSQDKSRNSKLLSIDGLESPSHGPASANKRGISGRESHARVSAAHSDKHYGPVTITILGPSLMVQDASPFNSSTIKHKDSL